MKKTALIILDGWGLGSTNNANAIAQAKTPVMHRLFQSYPHAQLLTSGENVGLPEGQMGNSEVGHMNIGAGRIVWQELARINNEIREHKLEQQPALKQLFSYASASNKPLHLLGLVSDGGVHSHINHLKRICELAHEAGIMNVFVHAFTDGRDTDPNSGIRFILELEDFIRAKKLNARIATICGRYYAMDRDKRWERVALAYNLLVKGEGARYSNAPEAMQASYNDNVTDEFIKPVVITGTDSEPLAMVKPGDAVLCFNFRTDRCREITQVLTQENMPAYGMSTLDLYYVTMTSYDDKFKNVKVIYEKKNLDKTLGEILSLAGKTQLRIAETEKYPHVTFFFNGGREEPFVGESRIMIPSPKVATYDLKPEMSALEVTDAVVKEITEHQPDFICLNFANPDMVGHTGVFKAVINAIETVDTCLGKVIEAGKKFGYSFIIIADHGNADYMINDDGSPNTAHTTNPVPCILVDDRYHSISNGILADLAPTILQLMDVQIPAEMNGAVLVS